MVSSVKVAVIFSEGKKPKPIWFNYDGERFDIAEICYFWTFNDGAATVSCYSVTTDKGFFELTFNSISLAWEAERKIS